MDQEKLMGLPGVDETTAKMVMKYAWQKIEGVPIDTKVHRMLNRL